MPTSRSSQEIIRCTDGTEIVFRSWLADPDRALMQPGQSSFSAECPVHGQLDESYESVMVGFAINDHAKQHGRLDGWKPIDVLALGPSIQL